jgi:MFS family permease
VQDATIETAARSRWGAPRRRGRWFLANFGILYGIALAAGCVVVAVGLITDSTESFRWGWLWAILLVGSIGVWFTIFFTFPAFTLYLVRLRLARRWWPRRVTAWILTPLLIWAVLWTWPADGEGSWWTFALALVCVAAAATRTNLMRQAPRCDPRRGQCPE